MVGQHNNGNLDPNQMAFMRIEEKIYHIIMGVTVAFLAVSFSSIQNKFLPVNAMWIITLYAVTRDWLDLTAYEFLRETRTHHYVSMVYLLCLLLLPISLRLIEGGVWPIAVYPTVILVLTILSLIYLCLCYKSIRNSKQPKKNEKKRKYAMLVAQDAMALMLYALVLLVCVFWGKGHLSWILIGIIGTAMILFEDCFDKMAVRRLTDWILRELTSEAGGHDGNGSSEH